MYTPAGENSESSQSAAEGGSPSSRRSSTRALNMEELKQELKNKEEKYENEVKTKNRQSVFCSENTFIQFTKVFSYFKLL